MAGKQQSGVTQQVARLGWQHFDLVGLLSLWGCLTQSEQLAGVLSMNKMPIT